MTKHPLGEEIYAAYAAGVLSAPMKLLVETQTVMSDDVAGSVRDSEAISGALLEVITPVSVKDQSLKEIFAVIDTEEAGLGEAGTIHSTPETTDRTSRTAAEKAGQAIDEILNLPDSVRDLALENGDWQFAGPGVRRMNLMQDGPAKAELIRLEPGCGVPHHGHDSKEFTLVLCGAFHDGFNRYGKGELCAADPDLQHKPVAESGEVCIALAVSDGSMAFTGPLGWVQRALDGLR